MNRTNEEWVTFFRQVLKANEAVGFGSAANTTGKFARAVRAELLEEVKSWLQKKSALYDHDEFKQYRHWTCKTLASEVEREFEP